MNKKQKTLIDKTILMRKAQLEIYKISVLNPIRRLIKIAEDVKKGKYPVTYYLKESKRFYDWIQKFHNKRIGDTSK